MEQTIYQTIYRPKEKGWDYDELRGPIFRTEEQAKRYCEWQNTAFPESRLLTEYEAVGVWESVEEYKNAILG